MTADPIPKTAPSPAARRDYTLPAAEPASSPRVMIAPVLPEPPLLCRLGVHRLRVDHVLQRRRAGLIQLCSATSRCTRPGCTLVRHEQNRPLPRRRSR